MISLQHGLQDRGEEEGPPDSGGLEDNGEGPSTGMRGEHWV